MSDPAIEAAQRAIGNIQRSEPYRWAESGAREALAPLREPIEEAVEWNPIESSDLGPVYEAGAVIDLLNRLSSLIYPSEELP